MPAVVSAAITIEPSTWNVIGLDSNSPLTGPNRFPVGAKVCGGVPDTSTTATLTWDSNNTPTEYIDLRTGSKGAPGNPITITYGANGCADAFFEVEVQRDANAYDKTRRYHITAGGISTPTPRELKVERLVSQARNAITNMEFGTSLASLTSVPNGGSMDLVIGNTYYIRMTGYTATQGYEQLESFVNFPNTIFQILSVSSTYSADTSPIVNSPNDKLYADACGWDNDPLSPSYLSCYSDGKAGGTVVVTYQVKIVATAGSRESLGSLIHDFSGSSFHYNSDYSATARWANIVDPTALTISKDFSPAPTNVNGVSSLTLTLSNSNYGALSNVSFTDIFPCQTCTPVAPGDMTLANTTTTNTCGGTLTDSGGGGLNAGDVGIQLDGATIPANSSCSLVVNITTSSTGTYTNTTGNVFVGSTDSGKNATQNLTVNNEPAPGTGICGNPMATWTFTTPFTASAPVPTTNALGLGNATARPGGGITSISGTSRTADGTVAWGSDGNIATGTTLTTSNDDYFEFYLNATNFTSVTFSFYARRTNNGPKGVAVFYSNQSDNGAGGTEPNPALYNKNGTVTNEALQGGIGWFSFGPFTINSPPATTYIRIYGYNANNSNSASDIYIDDVIFSGCGQPTQPTIAKAFSPSPIASGGTSTLTFTLTNPNSVALNGAAFSDTFPTTPGNMAVSAGSPNGASVSISSGSPTVNGTGTSFTTRYQAGERVLINGNWYTILSIASNTQMTLATNAVTTAPATSIIASTYNCGTPTFTPVAGAGSITFSNGTLPGSGSCIAKVNVTAPVAGTYSNTSSFLSTTEGGTNKSSIATASLKALRAPTIAKNFAPDPIFTGGISTLTFLVTNPNQNDDQSGVAFTDTFPVAPGAMVVANPTNATTSNCGAPTFTPAVGAGSISFSNGTIAGGGTCTVSVNVTAPTAGTYSNTSGNVSHDLNGIWSGGTANDSLTVETPNPAIALLKQVGPSSSGPWSSYLAVAAGGSIYYKFTVENLGDVPLSPFSVSDPGLSVPLSLASCSWKDGDGNTLTAPLTLPAADADNGHLATCTLGPATAGASGSYSNTAVVFALYGGVPVPPDPPESDDDHSTATYAISGLTLVKNADKSYFMAEGETISYSYVISNTGSAVLTGPLTVTVADNQIATVTCPAVTATTITATGLPGNGDIDFNPGESLTCTASYTASASDVNDKQIVNVARATVSGANITTQYTPQVTKTVPLAPDLSVTKSNSVGGNASTNIPFDWALTTSNAATAGTASFSNGQMLLTDDLPSSGATYSAPAVATNAGGTTGVIICSIAASTLTCTANGAVSIPSGGSFSIDVTTTPTVAGSLVNPDPAGVCRVDPGTLMTELDETNNSCSDTVTVTTPAITLIKTANKSFFVAEGEEIQYTYTVRNTGATIPGPGPPPGPAVISINDDKVASVTCDAVTAIGNGNNDFDANEELTCRSNAPHHLVTAGEVNDRQVTNIATATVAGAGAPVLSPQVSLSVPIGPDLSVVKTHPVSTPIPGLPFNWTLTVTNAAAAGYPANYTVGQVLLQDDLPAGPTYTVPATATPTGTTTGTINCAVATDVLTCTAGGDVSIPAGSGFSIAVATTAASGGTLSNPKVGGICRVDPSGTVPGPSNGLVLETNESNNDCSDSLLVGMPSITMLKTMQPYWDPVNGFAPNARAIPGALVEYTLLVTNSGYGPSDAGSIKITDPLSTSLELFVGDINGAGSGPIRFIDGATASGLSYSYLGLNNMTDGLEFSDNGGASYLKNDTAADANGCDPTVTHFRISLNGPFNGTTDGINYPSFTLKFRTRVK